MKFFFILLVYTGLFASGNARTMKTLEDTFSFITHLISIQNQTQQTIISDKEHLSKKNVQQLAKHGQTVLKRRFKRYMMDLPGYIEEAIRVITKSIEKTNSVNHSFMGSFILAALAESLGSFIIQKRQIQYFFNDLPPLLSYGYSWSYALGFGLPFYLGLEEADQNCTAADFKMLVDKYGLTLPQVYKKSVAEVHIGLHSFRSELAVRLSCVTSKQQRFKEAAIVNMKIEELTSIVPLFKDLLSLAASKSEVSKEMGKETFLELSIEVSKLDSELSRIWQNFEPQVKEARNEVYAVRFQENAIKVAIGVINILGMVFGVLNIIVGVPDEKIPSMITIPVVIVTSFLKMLQGRISDGFLLGEAFILLAQLCWGYGYFGPIFTALLDPNPGCGVYDLQIIMRSYSEFSNFTDTFGSPDQIHKGKYWPSELPKLTKFRLKTFVHELKTSLHCIVTRNEKPAIDFTSSIDYWMELALLRIDLTSSLLGLVE